MTFTIRRFLSSVRDRSALVALAAAGLSSCLCAGAQAVPAATPLVFSRVELFGGYSSLEPNCGAVERHGRGQRRRGEVDTIPKPDGLAEAAAMANPDGDRAEIERGPDGVRCCPMSVRG